MATSSRSWASPMLLSRCWRRYRHQSQRCWPLRLRWCPRWWHWPPRPWSKHGTGSGSRCASTI
eukprot:1872082-Lingulodinium_polyedra.AAC.1